MASGLSNLFIDPAIAPDFTAISFYKIFGFPDLGGLVVRKEDGHILKLRNYFGGGAITLASVLERSWHQSKGSLFEKGLDIRNALEDGTLPFHFILALGISTDVHQEIFGNMKNIPRHTSALTIVLYNRLLELCHEKGFPMVEIYCSPASTFGNPAKHDSTIAFHIRMSTGKYISYSEVEKHADIGIYIRSDGMCCPGGITRELKYSQWELLRANSAGHACGYNVVDIVGNKPTGVERVSLGAMTSMGEVDTFINFLIMMYSKPPQTLKNPIINLEAIWGMSNDNNRQIVLSS